MRLRKRKRKYGLFERTPCSHLRRGGENVSFGRNDKTEFVIMRLIILGSTI